MTLFLTAIIASGLGHIFSDYKEKWSLTYIFKPLTMLIIIGMVFVKADLEIEYSQWILLGLGLSLIGDIFLMLRPQKFIAGLVSFLLAHLAYCYAFYQSLIGNDIHWLAGVLLPFGLIYLVILWKHLKSYKIPVLCYFLAIGTMLFLATALLIVEVSLMSKYALVGAILFAISDGILAWRKFAKPMKYGQFYVMTTYFAAQTLLALSAVYYWS